MINLIRWPAILFVLSAYLGIFPVSVYAYVDFRLLHSSGNYSAVYTWTPPSDISFNTITVPLYRWPGAAEMYSARIVSNADGTILCQTDTKNSAELPEKVLTAVKLSCASTTSLSAGTQYVFYFVVSGHPSNLSMESVFGCCDATGTFFPRVLGTCLAAFTDADGNYPVSPWSPLSCYPPAQEGAEFALDVMDSADLALSITDTPDPVIVGENFTYKLIVSNNGPGTTTEVQ